MNLKPAVKKLREEQNLLKVEFIPVTIGPAHFQIIGIADINPKTNLGSYQNMMYYVVDASTGETLVIDPGIRGRRGSFVRDSVGIAPVFSVITHYHLDHWIGLPAYRDRKVYASPRCIHVLTGKEDTAPIKIFDDGRLTFGHIRETPVKAIEDAKRFLPLPDYLFEPYWKIPDKFPVRFFELPGQTMGNLYGLLESDEKKIVFGADLFIDNGKGNQDLLVEPHYSEEIDVKVMINTILVLKAIVGQEFEIPEGYDEFPQLKDRLLGLFDPDFLLLGHGCYRMTAGNKRRIVELINGLEQIISLHQRFII